MRLLYSPEVNEYLRLPDEVKYVASLTPSVTEVLVEMGLERRVVGVSAWCKLLARSRGYSALLNKPVVGDYVNINQVALRSADLVLLSGGVQRGLVSKLRNAGLFYYVISLPKSVWGIAEFIIQVAAAINEVGRGIELATKYTEELSKLRNYVRTPEVKVYVELDLGTATIPGLFTHIVTGLEFIGLKTLNSRIYTPYTFGDRAVEISRELIDAADVIIYESSRYRLTQEEVYNRMVARGAYPPKKIIVLPPLTLSDYGPKFTDVLKDVADALLRSI